MYLILFSVLAFFLLLCLASFCLLKVLIGRKKPTDHEHLTPKELSWNARFGELFEEGEAWFRESLREKWTLSSFDGVRLVGDFVPCPGSHRYAICIHGYTGDRREMRKYGTVFASWGINVLLPDNRAHGESEGKWIGMGALDSRDAAEWVKKIVEKDPLASIFLFGVSMGGATVMMASGLEMPENVRFYVEDCGYTSVWNEFAHILKGYHLPSFPILHLVSFFSRLFAGYTFQESSSCKALARNSRPFLFIHGKTDTFVPYEMLDEIVSASSSDDQQVLRVEGAGHALSVAKAQKEYFSAIQRFVEEYLN